MRKFGTDSPEFFIFQLEGSEEVYKVPVPASMPYGILKKVNGGFESQVEMLREYMGDVVDDLPVGDLRSIITAWARSSDESGASLGES